MALSWKSGLRWLVLSGAVCAACSASSPGDTPRARGPISSDAGPTLLLPNDEVCGNAIDDDGDGLVDEGCDCAASGSSSGEFGTPCAGEPDAATGCIPTASSEVTCDDGRDDDCDGLTDCEAPECQVAGQCGCAASETQCGDGMDDDCDGLVDCADEDCGECVPGTTRYCDEPVYCAWGQQTCGPDGRWGKCTEVPTPSGCEGFFGFDNFYDQDCCVAHGFCCQAYPANQSVGNCQGVAVCS
jgi:hypothetical protein